jgi:primase-polymerase (primpol)-like protein
MTTANGRPQALPVRPEGIPSAIKALPNWALWYYDYDEQKDKWDKPPYQGAASTKPETWKTFDEAYELYVRNGFDGLYFALPLDRSINGGDFDHCRNSTGFIRPAVEEWVQALDTYTEISPSGTGLRTIGLGSKPSNAHSKNTETGDELYDCKRFLSITGQAYNILCKLVHDATSAKSESTLYIVGFMSLSHWSK